MGLKCLEARNWSKIHIEQAQQQVLSLNVRRPKLLASFRAKKIVLRGFSEYRSNIEMFLLNDRKVRANPNQAFTNVWSSRSQKKSKGGAKVGVVNAGGAVETTDFIAWRGLVLALYVLDPIFC